MNADQKAWIERLDWIRNQLCRPSVTGLDAKLSTELLAKIDEQAAQLAAAAATIERLRKLLAKIQEAALEAIAVNGMLTPTEAVARIEKAAARELEGQSDE